MSGADFTVAIKAVQTAAKGFVEHRKVPLEKRVGYLSQFKKSFLAAEAALTGQLVAQLGYPQSEAKYEFEQAVHILEHLEEKLKSSSGKIPLGPCLVYGSWSSPLIRVCQTVVSALALGNSVLILSGSAATSLYDNLTAMLTAAGWDPTLVGVVSTENPETQETLLSHPSIRAVHWTSHHYEARLVREMRFEANKKVKLFFGGHNPVIFLHDAPLEKIPELLEKALRYHVRGEERFQRWFVQDKNFDLFVSEVKKSLSTFTPEQFGHLPEPQFKEAFLAQMQDLSKERGWITSPGQPLASDTTLGIQIAADFNNCSPWQQSQNLGPLLTVTRFKNSQEAIKFTNTTLFANAACVFSGSKDRSAEVAEQLYMPRVHLNTLPNSIADTANDAGYESGQGNEVSDFEFFTYPKTVL